MKKHSRDKETERERSKSSGAIELNAARQAGRPGQAKPTGCGFDCPKRGIRSLPIVRRKIGASLARRLPLG